MVLAYTDRDVIIKGSITQISIKIYLVNLTISDHDWSFQTSRGFLVNVCCLIIDAL